jgi:hypothetical protein
MRDAPKKQVQSRILRSLFVTGSLQDGFEGAKAEGLKPSLVSQNEEAKAEAETIKV